MPTIKEMLTSAVQLHQARLLQEAENAYRAILQFEPHEADALHLLGLICHETGRSSMAYESMTLALRVRPNFPEAHFNLGVVYQNQGRLDEAAASYRQALRCRPNYAEAHFNLGNTLRDQNRFTEAETSYREAIRCQPNYLKAYNNLGTVLQDLGREDEAVVVFQETLRLKPGYATGYSNLGGALRVQGKLTEAIAHCEQALRLEPGNGEALNNLGAALLDQGNVDEALRCFQEALRVNPGYANAQSNMGAALQDLDRTDEALASYAEAVRLRPNHTNARTNRGLVYLLQGDFEKGWPEYEWRWQHNETDQRLGRQLLWDGSSLTGRTILLRAEQGLGDTLHFIRYAPLVKERGGTVIAQCQAPLLKILATCPGIDQLIAQGSPLPPIDAQIPLLSLPGIFRTNLATIPAPIPYLSADPQLIDHWRRELSAFDGFKIGISWQGNPKHKSDRNRSIPLAHFERLARVPGVKLFSLQKGFGSEQLRDIADRFNVMDLGSRLDEANGAFMDTAAVMKNLDLVISSDTATVHLAGALGVPTWLALPFAPDWRWLLDRTDSPWYPSMRLFRQQQRGDWANVFERMAHELAQKLRPVSTTTGIRVDIAPGELIDKITILEIKSERITDAAKLQNVQRELDLLASARDRFIAASSELTKLTAELKGVNEQLWEIEDAIRDCERQDDFGPRFIKLARAVYRTNDQRATLKRSINDLLGSAIVEEKSYADYASGSHDPA